MKAYPTPHLNGAARQAALAALVESDFDDMIPLEFRLMVVDLLLNAAEPVIRQQERAKVAEEIAVAIGEECRVRLLDIPGLQMGPVNSTTAVARATRDHVAAAAAAIARSHSTPKGQDRD